MLVEVTFQILYLTIMLILLKEALKGIGVLSKSKLIFCITLMSLSINYIFYGINKQTTFESITSLLLVMSISYIFSIKST